MDNCEYTVEPTLSLSGFPQTTEMFDFTDTFDETIFFEPTETSGTTEYVDVTKTLDTTETFDYTDIYDIIGMDDTTESSESTETLGTTDSVDVAKTFDATESFRRTDSHDVAVETPAYLSDFVRATNSFDETGHFTSKQNNKDEINDHKTKETLMPSNSFDIYDDLYPLMTDGAFEKSSKYVEDDVDMSSKTTHERHATSTRETSTDRHPVPTPTQKRKEGKTSVQTGSFPSNCNYPKSEQMREASVTRKQDCGFSIYATKPENLAKSTSETTTTSAGWTKHGNPTTYAGSTKCENPTLYKISTETKTVTTTDIHVHRTTLTTVHSASICQTPETSGLSRHTLSLHCFDLFF
ncbi:MAG: hypothetical protein K0U78_14295 [Actinomycetia bacterium]|nr:hypothetical protein [Actinomycetes bacterium]